jgi:hypothetical protein
LEEANPSMLLPVVTATTFDVSLIMRESTQGLTASCIYKARLFDAKTIDNLLLDFQSVLEQMATRPEEPISTVGVVLNEKLPKLQLRA